MESNGNLAHFTVFASMQRTRVMHENRLISRVNLPLFTLIVRQGKVYETLIMRSWTWVKKKRKKFVTWNVTETRKNGNVMTEMWRKHDRSFPTRKHDWNASRPWKTRSPCRNVTDISNLPFPSSLQNTETRYFVLCTLISQPWHDRWQWECI